MAILARMPKSGAITYPAIRKFLEWEHEIIVKSQMIAISLIHHEFRMGKDSNTQNLAKE